MTSIVSFEDIKSYANLTKDSISDYPAIEVNVDLVHAAIEEYCGRSIAVEDSGLEFSYHEFDRTRHVYLNNLPITAINSFALDGVLVDPSRYTVGLYGLVCKFDINDQDIHIDYDAGYESEDDIPRALYRAELIQIVYEYQTNDHIGASAVSTDGGSVSTPELGLLKTVKQLLNPFVHISRIN